MLVVTPSRSDANWHGTVCFGVGVARQAAAVGHLGVGAGERMAAAQTGVAQDPSGGFSGQVLDEALWASDLEAWWMLVEDNCCKVGEGGCTSTQTRECRVGCNLPDHPEAHSIEIQLVPFARAHG